MRARLLVLLFLFLPVHALAQYPYEIERYHVGIELRKDATMTVSERIEVLFNESRRGIFRYIPIHLPTDRGVTKSISITDVDVRDGGGNRLTTKISREGPNIMIRIGNEDVFLPPGTRQTYVIRYEVFGMLNWFDEDTTWDPFVELYWNLTGDEWDTAINGASIDVTYPDIGKGRARARIYVGPYGSAQFGSAGEGDTDASLPGLSMNLGQTRFQATYNEQLRPYEGLTLVLGLPAETIPKPPFVVAATHFLKNNGGFLIPLIVLLGFIPLFLRHGRDPHGGPMVVQYDPPEGLSGPEVGVMIDERVDQRDLAAGLISLAVKGYIEIYPEEEGLIFKRKTAELVVVKAEAGPDLNPFEAKLLRLLPGTPGTRIDTMDLREHVAPQAAELKDTLYECLVNHDYYMKNPNTVRAAWLVGGIAVVGALGVLFFALSPTKEIPPSIVGGVIGAILVWTFSRGMPKRTPKGSKARMKVVGFEEFIKRAHEKELDWMTKKHPDQALFETYLPHAVAFGLTREWADAFKGIDLEMPRWYHGTYTGYWSPVWLASDLTAVTDSVTSAALTPPRSSGASGGHSGFGGGGFGGGGGFSGGGFGGGGGGSW